MASEASIVWGQFKADLLPALRVDKHVAKPVAGGKKVHFYLKDGKVVSADDEVVDTVEE